LLLSSADAPDFLPSSSSSSSENETTEDEEQNLCDIKEDSSANT
jgi:hypothetical protein